MGRRSAAAATSWLGPGAVPGAGELRACREEGADCVCITSTTVRLSGDWLTLCTAYVHFVHHPARTAPVVDVLHTNRAHNVHHVGRCEGVVDLMRAREDERPPLLRNARRGGRYAVRILTGSPPYKPEVRPHPAPRLPPPPYKPEVRPHPARRREPGGPARRTESRRAGTTTR